MDYPELLNRLAGVYPGCGTTAEGRQAFGRARLRRLAAIWKDANVSRDAIDAKLLETLPLAADRQRTLIGDALRELWPA